MYARSEKSKKSTSDEPNAKKQRTSSNPLPTSIEMSNVEMSDSWQVHFPSYFFKNNSRNNAE
jgi:hypothetical protein